MTLETVVQDWFDDLPARFTPPPWTDEAGVLRCPRCDGDNIVTLSNDWQEGTEATCEAAVCFIYPESGPPCTYLHVADLVLEGVFPEEGE